MGGANAGLPSKRTNLSTRPLKALNWTKIAPLKVQETLWKDLGTGDEEYLKKLGDSIDEFEDLFAAKDAKDITATKRMGDARSQVDLKAQEISFLDSKRSQNCNIMLKAIKIPIQEIRSAVNAVDTNTLPRHILSELLKFVPTDDELKELASFANDLDNLASAERFLWEISQIERYEDKLKAMLFKTTYEEVVDDIETMISNLKSAIKGLKESKQWREMLKLILALGNYMNNGQRGGAYGFKVNSLLKVRIILGEPL